MAAPDSALKPRRKQGIEQRRGLPRAFLPFQHPRLVAKPPMGPGWVHEVKFDGYRFQVHVEAGRARLYTRNGHDWTHCFPYLAAQARAA
jgi:bifunctional non-homologous end joining protein LigD